MTWMLILLKLLELFGPFILEWLRRLLTRAAGKMSYPLSRCTESDAISELFRAAEREMSWFDIILGRRAILRAVGRVALRRSSEIFSAARTGAPMEPLTEAEIDEMGFAA